MLKRHSSRRNNLDQSVLNQRLDGAVSYDRIAGYFRSSLFEVAGETLAAVARPVRIICNSDLDPQDLATAASAQAARRRSWCAGVEQGECAGAVITGVVTFIRNKLQRYALIPPHRHDISHPP